MQAILRKFWVKAQKHDKMDGAEKLLSISQCQTTVVYSVTVHVLSTLGGSTPAFEEYCNIWKLTVNTNKTTIVLFSKKKYKTNAVFKIYGQAIYLQDLYSYLGVIFNYNGNFCTARKKLLDQANKALYDQCKLWQRGQFLL